MKKILYLVVFALFFISLNAQVTCQPVYNKSCLRYVNDPSKLRKCNNNQIYKDLTKNIVYPSGTVNSINGGRVLVKVLVNIDGTFEIEILESSHHDYSIAVWNAFKKIKPWLLSATSGEKKVPYIFILPVTFPAYSMKPSK